MRSWNRRELLQQWRERWAETVNTALTRIGVDTRIDHRSYKAQGVTQEPTPKIGRAAWEMERRGLATRRGARWREVRQRNADPFRERA